MLVYNQEQPEFRVAAGFLRSKSSLTAALASHGLSRF